MLALSSLSILLAYFSWRYIEKPFRSSSAFSRRQIFLFALLGMVILIFLGFMGSLKNGFEHRYSEKDLVFLRQINEENSDYVIERFNSLKYADWDSANTKVFLVGDSYAQDLTNAIYESGLNENYSISTWHISAPCGNLYIRLEEKEEFISDADLPLCVKTDFFKNYKFSEQLKTADEIWLASSWKPWQIE